MLERRRWPRTKVYKGARIVLAGRCTINCIVRDLTNYGACIHVESTADLPAEFDLAFDTGRTLRHSRVAWRADRRLGVSFEDARAA
jgi:hypothetical protein